LIPHETVLFVAIPALALLVVIATSEVLARKGVGLGLVARRDLAAGLRVPTAGGLGFLPGMVGVLVLLGLEGGDPTWLMAAVGALFFALLGLLDDIVDLPAAVKLVVETVACVPLVVVWVGPSGAGLAALCLLLLVGSINVVNLSDNSDGLAASLVATTAAGALACAALSSDNSMALLAATVLAVCAGFLVHNRPRAALHMGDTGSTSLGFVMGFMLARLTIAAGPTPTAASIAALGLLLGCLLVDGVQVVAARAAAHRLLLRGDLRHLSHRLLKLYGDRRKVIVKLWAPHAMFVAGAVVVHRWPELWAIVVAPMVVGAARMVGRLWSVPGEDYAAPGRTGQGLSG
jgi:UDP-GlcNAc:undecaprenyl-phosphate GlcNAc-1-phosphate transferase